MVLYVGMVYHDFIIRMIAGLGIGSFCELISQHDASRIYECIIKSNGDNFCGTNAEEKAKVSFVLLKYIFSCIHTKQGLANGKFEVYRILAKNRSRRCTPPFYTA